MKEKTIEKKKRRREGILPVHNPSPFPLKRIPSVVGAFCDGVATG